MPTIFSHALVSSQITFWFKNRKIPKRIFLIAALLSIFPDFDVIGFKFGVEYGDLWGHRGMTHSIFFGLLVSLFMMIFFISQKYQGLRLRIFLIFLLSILSHGFFDGLTNGGLGIAYFAPFDQTRYFLPITPVKVSPISIDQFFSLRGLEVIKSEFLWIISPFFSLSLLIYLWRRNKDA
jgi:inner membrane protein